MKKKYLIIIGIIVLIVGGVSLYYLLKKDPVDEQIQYQYKSSYQTSDGNYVLKMIDDKSSIYNELFNIYGSENFEESYNKANGYAYLNNKLVEIIDIEDYNEYLVYKMKYLYEEDYVNSIFINITVDKKTDIIISKDDRISFEILKAMCGYFLYSDSFVYTVDMKYLGYYNKREALKEDSDGIYVHDVKERYCYCPPNAVCAPCMAPTSYPLVKYNAKGERLS